jgi:hypothetical protein
MNLSAPLDHKKPSKGTSLHGQFHSFSTPSPKVKLKRLDSLVWATTVFFQGVGDHLSSSFLPVKGMS